MSLHLRLLFLRRRLLPAAALCALAPTLDALARPPVQIDPFVVRTQGYAALDLSGASSAAGSPASLVALGDDNRAAFAVRKEHGPDGQPAELDVYTFVQGVLTAAEPLNLERAGAAAGGAPATDYYAPGFLLGSGQVFGTYYGAQANSGFSALGDACSDLPMPARFVPYRPAPKRRELRAVASDGTCAGAAIYANTIFAGGTYNPADDSGDPATVDFITRGGLSDCFSPDAPAWASDAATRVHPQEHFDIHAINVNGWALGVGYDSSGSSVFYTTSCQPLGDRLWDADRQQLVSLPAPGVALNDDNDILVGGAINPATSRREGAFLFERGNTTQKRYFLPEGSGPGLLPANAREHLRDLQPLLVSNRARPADAAATTLQPVLHVVFSAEVQREPAAWQPAAFLLRQFSDGAWDLREIIGAEQFELRSINAAGVIAAISRANSTVAPAGHALLLLPVDLAVDADRNGLVEFDTDATSPAHPFRFWINEDYDHDENGEEPGGVANGADSAINGVRDLEDFTQVKFRLPRLLADLVKAGKAQLGFKWKDRVPDGPMPVARLWSGSPSLDRPTYLKDAGVAQQVVSANNSQPTGAAGTASLTQGFIPVWLRAGVMDTVAADASDRCTVNLLMEGVDVGAARLTLVVKVNGLESEGPAVDLKLLHVRQMYERGKVPEEAPAVPDPWLNRPPPTLGWTWDPWQWPPDVDPFADEKTIAYVHGWRMTYNEYIQWADTTFKRLWQLGYQGRFYSFRWPTYHGDNVGMDLAALYKPGGLSYNPSEYRAWLSGPALAGFVNGLPNANNRYLIAHSMGNVVSGSALRSGMQVTRYAMCNSAMAAMAYNGALPPNVPVYQTPDTDADDVTRQTFGLADKFNLTGTKLINFSLPEDSALGSWSENNKLFKPQTLMTNGGFYSYLPAHAAGRKLEYYSPDHANAGPVPVTFLPEAMAYVTQSRTRAAGARQDTLPPSATVKMDEDGMEFDKQHSAEWIYSIQRTYPFWRRVAAEFEVDLSNR